MRNMFILLFLFLASAAYAGPSAVVSIPPQKYFVDAVSGGLVPVSIMVPAGANPHTYEPKPRQMAELAAASAYFTIGGAFDHVWLERIRSANPNIAIIHTEDGVPLAHMDGSARGHDHESRKGHEGHAGHKGHEGHAGHEAGLDPHIWLDPALVRMQVEHIRDGLCQVDPERAEQYRANAARFQEELAVLDQEIRGILAPIPAERRAFLVFHPSWGYFAKAYGLRQVAIENEGKEPGPKELARIIALGKEVGATAVFVQPQFSAKTAAVIAGQLQATVRPLDPLAENWAENLRGAAQALAAGLH